jgi:hypothetical protein
VGLFLGGIFSGVLWKLGGLAVVLNGSYLPLFLAVAPAGFGLAVWPVVGTCLALREVRWCRVAAIALVLLSYLAWIIECWMEHLPIWQDLRHSGGIAIAAELFYLAGQLAIWRLVCRCQVVRQGKPGGGG